MHGVHSSSLHWLVRWSLLCGWLGLGALLGLGGCATPPPYPPLSPPASLSQDETWARATYQLAVGDRVRFISWSVPEISCEVQVAADGTVVYPYVGTVQARGRTVVQLETELETELGQRLAAAGLGWFDPQGLDLQANADAYLLSRKLKIRLVPYVLDLHADVIAYGRTQVAVLGEVRLPGVYPWQPDTTPLALIAQAGGLTANAWYVALLIRAVPPQAPANSAPLASPALRLDLHKLFLGEGASNLRLAGGDTLYVPPAGMYQVLGRVRYPGQYRLQRNTTVLQALAQAGGLKAFAATNRLTVWRYHVHNATCGGELCLRHVARFVMDESPQAFRVSMDDVLQPGDVLMVPTGFLF
jgi:polysaccharide biosynthesis/export protein